VVLAVASTAVTKELMVKNLNMLNIKGVQTYPHRDGSQKEGKECEM